MSFERLPTAPAFEAPPAAAPDGTDGARPEVTPALRLQILATEHWSLLATRSLAWNEVFARAGMFLSLLSGAIVALALVGQGSGFGDAFPLFGIAILPVVLFLGVTTYIRLGTANYADAMCVVGMNRIRAGYLEMAPDLERFFVTGVHDDAAGMTRTLGVEPGTSLLAQQLVSTPTVVSVINAVLAGAIAGFAALALRGPAPLVVATAIVVFGAVFVVHTRYSSNRIRRIRGSVEPMFPSPPPA